MTDIDLFTSSKGCATLIVIIVIAAILTPFFLMADGCEYRSRGRKLLNDHNSGKAQMVWRISENKEKTTWDKATYSLNPGRFEVTKDAQGQVKLQVCPSVTKILPRHATPTSLLPGFVKIIDEQYKQQKEADQRKQEEWDSTPFGKAEKVIDGIIKWGITPSPKPSSEND